MANAVIETHQLSRTFGKGDKAVVAVDSVDLRVEEGQVFGFLGPNGAGKSTTLRMLATLISPTGGSATVAGHDLRRDPQGVRQVIGYVQQGNGTDPAVTGRAELILQGQLYGLSHREASSRSEALFAALDLDSCAGRPTGTWSGGQRRRLDFALGLIHRPRILFLDEPTTGLDPQGRARLWEEVQRLKETTTVFLTTHYLDEADALCDRLAIIDHGRIVAEGTADELKREIAGDLVTIGVADQPAAVVALLERQPFVREVSQGDAEVRVYVERGDEAMPAILRLLDGAGLRLQTISMARPSLDDVFLKKTGRSLREPAAA